MLFGNIDWIVLSICTLFVVAVIIEIAFSINYCRKLSQALNEYKRYQELPKDQKGQRVNTSIFNKNRTRSLLHFIPTLLTALGILGTFFGINKGLSGIDLTSVDTTDSLLENSKQLLGGMKIAFETSLWGLGGASLFILLIALCEWVRVNYRQGLIHQILAISNQDNELDKLDTIAQNTRKLSSFDSQTIGKEVGAAINPILLEIRDNLKEQQKDLTQNLIDVIKVDLIQPVVTTIEQNNKVTKESSQAVLQLAGINPILLEIRDDIREQQKDLTKNLIDVIKVDLIQPVVTTIEQNNKVTKESSQAVLQLAGINPILLEIRNSLREQQKDLTQNLIDVIKVDLIQPVVTTIEENNQVTSESSRVIFQFKNELAGVSEGLVTSIQTIQEFQTETLYKLQNFAENLEQILDQFRRDTEGVMERVANSLNEAVQESIQGMESQRSAFAASAQQASDTFRGIREDLQQSLTSQGEVQQKMLSGVHDSTVSILNQAKEAFSEQSNTLTRVGSEASELMNNASHNLTHTLNNIDVMLQNTRQTVQEELEKFRDNYQISLQNFFEQQNNLLENTLGQQREGLSEVVQELQTVFREDAQTMAQQVIESMNTIKKTTETVQNLANTIGLTSAERLAQIQEITQTLGSESIKINAAYENLVNRFNEGLTIWNQQLTQYFEQANQTYNQSRQDTDAAAAEVCQQLNNTSQGLMAVATYLVASSQDLKNNFSRP